MAAVEPTQVKVDIKAAPVQLTFENVCIDVLIKRGVTKRILSDVSGVIGPAELIAVMGPSGSGKTTFLNALTGVTRPSSGSIKVNGETCLAATMKRFTALVPQDDLLTPVLTASEALMEAARLKTRLSEPEALRRTESLLAQFGLVECRDVKIGHPEGTKGLSGGQKKRLSVALELMGQPSLIFLDEPTSGLDAVSAASLVRDLKALAQAGVTIVATIHQPSAKTFLTFDRLLLLAKGRQCYAGPVSLTEPISFFKEAGHECPPLHNPADFVMEVLASTTEVLDQLVARSAAKARWKQSEALAPLDTSGARFPSSFGTQLRTLVRRNVRVNLREPALVRARVASHALIGLVMGGIYFDLSADQTGVNDRVALTLFSIIFLMLSATLPTVIVLLPELAVTRKETRNNWYDVRPYYLAKLITDTPLLVVPPLLYVGTMGPMSGLVDSRWRFGVLYLAAMMQAFVAHAWAMILSCAAPNLAVAIFLAPLSIMPMMIFAGFFKNVSELTWVFRWISYIDHEAYVWEAFGIAAFHDLPLDPPLTSTYVLEQRLAIHGASMGRFWRSVGILVGFILLWRVSAFLVLKRKLR